MPRTTFKLTQVTKLNLQPRSVYCASHRRHACKLIRTKLITAIIFINHCCLDSSKWGLVMAKTHIHGDIPGHVDVGLILIHPNFCCPQRVPLGIVVNVVVVWFLCAFDVSYSSTREHLHTAATLPHLQTETVNNS